MILVLRPRILYEIDPFKYRIFRPFSAKMQQTRCPFLSPAKLYGAFITSQTRSFYAFPVLFVRNGT